MVKDVSTVITLVPSIRREELPKVVHIAGRLKKDITDRLSYAGINSPWLLDDENKVLTISPYISNSKPCGCSANLTCRYHLDKKVAEKFTAKQKDIIRSGMKEAIDLLKTIEDRRIKAQAKELFEKWREAELKAHTKNLEKQKPQFLYDPNDLV